MSATVLAPGRSVVLLRHGSAGKRRSWEGDDRDRPLDRHGRAQARALGPHLAPHLGPDPLVLTSPFVRCVTSVEPMVEARGGRLVTDDRLAEVMAPFRSDDGWPDAAWLGGRALAALEDACERTDADVVVCSHGEVLPALLAALAAREGFAVPGSLDLSRKRLPKGAAWCLRAIDGVQVSELSPPATNVR